LAGSKKESDSNRIMGRIQSSLGLITGTDIFGTVDQLIAISGQPRDRLVARTELLQQEQQAIAELTALVIGVQLAGKRLASPALFRSTKAESSDSEAIFVEAGKGAAAGEHVVRTLRTAATHLVRSLERFAARDQPLGYSGTMLIAPTGGSIDVSAPLTSLNDGRGVEPGVIRVTDRSGRASDVDLTDARTIDDVIARINAAEVDVRATISGNAITLTDHSGGTVSNLKVEQLSEGETAADLGLWGIDTANSSVTGSSIELSEGTVALRGVPLSELNGGKGIGPLGSLEITLSDGSSALVDLSAATTTAEIIDTIDQAGLRLIIGLNEARNGLRLRDVSGGVGAVTIASTDGTAEAIGLNRSTTDDIIVGTNLNRQSVTAETLLSSLNRGDGIPVGSFTIRDSVGAVGAVNLAVEGAVTVGELIDVINNLGIGVTAHLNDAGDGIAVVDTAGGVETMTIEDTGSGTTAEKLGIAGSASRQLVGNSEAMALVGTQAARVEVEATDTLDSLASKINSLGRYAEAAIAPNEDGTFSLRIRSSKGGSSGRVAINTDGFELDLRTESQGQDALIAVSTDGATERFLSSSDGVFEIVSEQRQPISPTTRLDTIAPGAGRGSFTITDSTGAVRAIHLSVGRIETLGELIQAINALGIGVEASINDEANGIAVVDTAGGDGTLEIADTGNGTIATSLGIAGTASNQTVSGNAVSALVGPAAVSDDQSGLTLTVKRLAESPITVAVAEDPDAAVSAAKTFVEQYNKLMEKLDALTFFNAESEEVGLLFGSSEALRIRNGYSRLLSGRISGAGNFASIGQVGLRLTETGGLDLDEQKLTEAMASNPDEIQSFFTKEQTGLSDRLTNLAERLAGVENGMLLNRGETLSSQIEFNNTRIESFNTRLERERERLLRQFYATEEAIARIQSNQAALDQIRPISIPT
jgi:flagellar hook-associated protein 2